jgi:hypothetical protein
MTRSRSTPSSPPNDPPVPNWVTRRTHYLKRTGHFSFIGEPSFDPPALAHPSLGVFLWLVKVLDISRTAITSLAGLPFLPRLTVLNADRSKLEDFTNFQSIKTTTRLSLKETPASKKPNYRLSILIVFEEDNRLISIDGCQISQPLRDQARLFPKYCSELVNRGWIAPARPPSFPQLQYLCEKHGLKPPSVISEEELFSEDLSEPDDDNFDGLLVKLREEHRDVWRKGKAQFGLLNDQEENLSDEILSIFQRYRLNNSAKPGMDVVTIVKELCKELDQEGMVEEESS